MQLMTKLALAFALAGTVSTAQAYDLETEAAKRYIIHTEVAKGIQVISVGSKEIQNGETAHFSDGKIKEIDGKVTVTCRTGLQRWLQFYKGRCNDPVREKKQVAIGFKAEIAAREGSDGNILVDVQANYVDVLREVTIPGVDADIHSAEFRDSSLNGSMILQPGETQVLRNGPPGEEVTLKLSVTPI